METSNLFCTYVMLNNTFYKRDNYVKIRVTPKQDKTIIKSYP